MGSSIGTYTVQLEVDAVRGVFEAAITLPVPGAVARVRDPGSAQPSVPTPRRSPRRADTAPRPERSATGSFDHGVSWFSRLFSAQVKPPPSAETWKPKSGLAMTLIHGAGVASPGPRSVTYSRPSAANPPSPLKNSRSCGAAAVAADSGRELAASVAAWRMPRVPADDRVDRPERRVARPERHVRPAESRARVCSESRSVRSRNTEPRAVVRADLWLRLTHSKLCLQRASADPEDRRLFVRSGSRDRRQAASSANIHERAAAVVRWRCLRRHRSATARSAGRRRCHESKARLGRHRRGVWCRTMAAPTRQRRAHSLQDAERGWPHSRRCRCDAVVSAPASMPVWPRVRRRWPRGACRRGPGRSSREAAALVQKAMRTVAPAGMRTPIPQREHRIEYRAHGVRQTPPVRHGDRVHECRARVRGNGLDRFRTPAFPIISPSIDGVMSHPDFAARPASAVAASPESRPTLATYSVCTKSFENAGCAASAAGGASTSSQ